MSHSRDRLPQQRCDFRSQLQARVPISQLEQGFTHGLAHQLTKLFERSIGDVGHGRSVGRTEGSRKFVTHLADAIALISSFHLLIRVARAEGCPLFHTGFWFALCQAEHVRISRVEQLTAHDFERGLMRN